MAGVTPHYGLEYLDSGDSFSLNGNQYTLADRIAIDRLLYVGAQGHVHSGAVAATLNPTLQGSLTVSSTGGSLAAGTTAYYVFTYVDSSGAETAASPSVSVTLPSGVATPGNPTITAYTTAGALPLGDYFYAVTAYTSVNTNETVANTSGYIYLSATGENAIQFAALPSGADGVNVYRKGPNEVDFLYLTSVAASGGVLPNFTDDGTLAETCNRGLPTASSNNATYSVTFTLPAAVPTGYTWNLYRTTTFGDWTDSFLASIIQNPGASPSLATSYVDVGNGNLTGTPPTTSQIIGSPSLINLATDTTGSLPGSQINNVPFEVTFAFPGPLSAPLNAKSVWVNPYTSATLLSVAPSLGRGSVPAANPVLIDIVKGIGTNPTYSAIFAGMATPVYPDVPVGAQVGPVTSFPAGVTLNKGDSISVNLTQVGGGASPTDHDLTVNIAVLITE